MSAGPMSPLAAGAAYVDGAIVPIGEARIPLTDWGFLRGDATYDVVHVWNRRFFRLDDHLARFRRNVARLRYALPVADAELPRLLARLVAATGLDAAYVNMTATRGSPRPGSRDPRFCDNRFYAFAIPFVWIASPEKQEAGIAVRVAGQTRIPPRSVDPTIKNFHWLDMTAGLMEALDAGADTALLCDAEGRVTEGPGFNLFLVEAGRLVTPASGVLDGITRRTVLEIGAALGLAPSVEDVPLARLRAADELFLTSTAGGVMPVASLDGAAVGSGRPGPITRRVRDTYWAWHDDPAYSRAVADVLASGAR